MLCVEWNCPMTHVGKKMANVHSLLVATCEGQHFGYLGVDGRITLMLRNLGVKGLQV